MKEGIFGFMVMIGVSGQLYGGMVLPERLSPAEGAPSGIFDITRAITPSCDGREVILLLDSGTASRLYRVTLREGRFVNGRVLGGRKAAFEEWKKKQMQEYIKKLRWRVSALEDALYITGAQAGVEGLVEKKKRIEQELEDIEFFQKNALQPSPQTQGLYSRYEVVLNCQAFVGDRHVVLEVDIKKMTDLSYWEVVEDGKRKRGVANYYLEDVSVIRKIDEV